MVAGGNGKRPVTQQRRSEYSSLSDPLKTGDLTEMSLDQPIDIALPMIGILLNFSMKGRRRHSQSRKGINLRSGTNLGT